MKSHSYPLGSTHSFSLHCFHNISSDGLKEFCCICHKVLNHVGDSQPLDGWKVTEEEQERIYQKYIKENEEIIVEFSPK